MLIDSHVNLHAPAFDADREAVIARAREAGVGLMINICDRLSNLDAVRAVAEAHPDIWHTVGTHPHEAKENPQLTAEELILATRSPKVVGVGECGLDYHYDLSPRETQRAVFAAHIDAARASGLPLIVHTREADDEMAEMLEEGHTRGPFRMLLHCYTSGADLLRRAAALGAWFSVSGIVTFKAADDVRARVLEMPADRIIVETDCPYLAPMPMRGKRNEPSYLPHVLAKLAEVRGWSVEEARRGRRTPSSRCSTASLATVGAQYERPAGDHDPGFWLFRRRAASGWGLGRLRPDGAPQPSLALQPLGPAEKRARSKR